MCVLPTPVCGLSPPLLRHFLPQHPFVTRTARGTPGLSSQLPFEDLLICVWEVESGAFFDDQATVEAWCEVACLARPS